jgi:predicted transcriptional regulator
MATPDLAGLLSSMPKKTAASTPPPGAPEAELARKTITTERRTQADTIAKADNDQRVIASRTSRQYLRSITIYLPRTAHQRVAEEAAARDTTRTALILTAINETHSRLGELTAEQAAMGGERDLFDIPQQRAAAEPAVQTTIRVTDSQLDAIENLARTHDLNRSHLIAGALRLYLT